MVTIRVFCGNLDIYLGCGESSRGSKRTCCLDFLPDFQQVAQSIEPAGRGAANWKGLALQTVRALRWRFRVRLSRIAT